jgi:hypothetical protein
MGVKNIIGELQVNGEKVDTKLLPQIINALTRQAIILPFYINDELVFAPITIGSFGTAGGSVGCGWGEYCSYENDTPYNFITDVSNGGVPLIIA